MDIYSTPYTYHIAWTALDKHYYGVRYAKGCSPEDLWKTYFTSSKIVEDFRKLHGEPDVIEVRRTFDTPEKARIWEERVLTKLDVTRNDKWLNANIGGRNFHSIGSDHYQTPEYRKIMSEAQLKISDQISKRQSGTNNSFYGRKHTEESNESRRKKLKGVKKPEKMREKMRGDKNPAKRPEVRQKISEKLSGPRTEMIECPCCGRILRGKSAATRHTNLCRTRSAPQELQIRTDQAPNSTIVPE